MTFKILLADNHTLVRAGIRALLEQIPDVTVVAEAGDGREALKLVDEHRPNLVLMDITMPVMNGLEATGRIVKEHPQTRVVMLSVHNDEEYVLQSLRAGAVGYLLKDAGRAELEMAVAAIARNETYLSPAVSRHVVGDYVRRIGGGGEGRLETLTPRQREILQLIAEGKSTKEIASILDVSVKTVETHRAQLMERLDIHDVAGLVRYAIRNGIVTADA
ncbi:MAG: response regulator transcription factor [Candidatus Binatia bacterium]